MKEHKLGSSSQETTTSLSLVSVGDLFAKMMAYRWVPKPRCMCPKTSLILHARCKNDDKLNGLVRIGFFSFLIPMHARSIGQ
jgi:hypothetical protein